MPKKLALILGTCLIFALSPLAVACESGTTSPPSIEELEEKSRIISFRLTSGETLTCLYYAASGDGTYESYSWLILDCDWESLTTR